ncbi:hypothetical protein EDB19DRAFT_1829460 [Suillus lakei]|nr:hypothetical protein EDB19DRAFT_1829460 [Suillus lakei]
MSSHDNGELIEGEDENDVIPNGAAPATTANEAAARFVSTLSHIMPIYGDFVVRPEVPRAITSGDLSFEHPPTEECSAQAVMVIDALGQAKSRHDEIGIGRRSRGVQVNEYSNVRALDVCHLREVLNNPTKEHLRKADCKNAEGGWRLQSPDYPIGSNAV